MRTVNKSKTKPEVIMVTKREKIVYEAIEKLSAVTKQVTPTMISEVTNITGRSLSGVMSSLVRKNIVITDGKIVRLNN